MPIGASPTAQAADDDGAGVVIAGRLRFGAAGRAAAPLPTPKPGPISVLFFCESHPPRPYSSLKHVRGLRHSCTTPSSSNPEAARGQRRDPFVLRVSSGTSNLARGFEPSSHIGHVACRPRRPPPFTDASFAANASRKRPRHSAVGQEAVANTCGCAWRAMCVLFRFHFP
jgi:hypothetical protein